MSEVEYECLLDAVRTAVAPVPEEDFLTYPPTFNPLPLFLASSAIATPNRRIQHLIWSPQTRSPHGNC